MFCRDRLGVAVVRPSSSSLLPPMARRASIWSTRRRGGELVVVARVSSAASISARTWSNATLVRTLTPTARGA